MSTREFDEAHFTRLEADARKMGDPEQLVREVAHKNGVRTSDLLSRSRHHHLVLARYELYKVLRAWGWSYPAIGAFVGRDHTTVLAAIKVPPDGTVTSSPSYPHPDAPVKPVKRGRPCRIDYVRDENGNLIRSRRH